MGDKFVQALAVSDTHGNRNALKQIARQFADVKYLFHLGDNVRDAVWLSDHMKKTTVVNVRGNCDVGSDVAEYEEVYIASNRIILCHGHTLKVKYGYERALYYAVEHDAQALLFGHTHVPYAERTEGVWLINPGSAGEPRDGRPTVAMLLIGKVGIIPKILPLQW